jgi:hypothetical protein
MLSLLLILACATSKPADTAGDSATGDSPPDTASLPECARTHEDCAPGARGCGGEGANMLPGSNCLACHAEGASGGRERAPVWSAGGTVYTDVYGSGGAAGVTVRVTDASGRVVSMRTASSGNFYTPSRLQMPLRAEVETADGQVRQMASSVETGACNSCHSCDGSAGGKLYAP